MSNRKYQRLSDGYHERSPFHPYQASSKHSGKNHTNCIADVSRERDRSPANSSGFSSRDNSPYSSTNRHSNSSPRSHRSKYSTNRSKDANKRGSSHSPSDSSSNSRDRPSRFNHISSNEEFPWSQHVSSSGKTYYYNFKTEKSQWEKPKEWLEREKREKDKTSQKQLTELKDREAGKEHNSRESNFGKSSKYSTSKMAPKDHHISERHEISRSYADEQSRDNHQPEHRQDRAYGVVKTSSAYTCAVSTASHRSTPAAANSSVSPAGSLQDVSPPSTPSSRPSMFEARPHTESPQLVSISPHVTQYTPTQSPHLQQQQYLPRHAVPTQNVYTTAAQQVPTSQYSAPQYSAPQYSVPQSSYAHYGHVNNGNQLHTPPTQAAASSDVHIQPALHPLQQATLLHQRQINESKLARLGLPQQYSVLSQPRVQPSCALIKEDNRVHNSPGSPGVFPHAATLTKEQFPVLPPLHPANLSMQSAHVQASTINCLSSHPLPTVNLQALAKYTDRSLTGHVSGWTTEGMEKQIQKLSDDGNTSASDANKIIIEQFQFQSQLSLLELRLDVGAKRVSSLRGITKTLELLLAESDKKSLT